MCTEWTGQDQENTTNISPNNGCVGLGGATTATVVPSAVVENGGAWSRGGLGVASKPTRPLNGFSSFPKWGRAGEQERADVQCPPVSHFRQSVLSKFWRCAEGIDGRAGADREQARQLVALERVLFVQLLDTKGTRSSTMPDIVPEYNIGACLCPEMSQSSAFTSDYKRYGYKFLKAQYREAKNRVNQGCFADTQEARESQESAIEQLHGRGFGAERLPGSRPREAAKRIRAGALLEQIGSTSSQARARFGSKVVSSPAQRVDPKPYTVRP